MDQSQIGMYIARKRKELDMLGIIVVVFNVILMITGVGVAGFAYVRNMGR